MLLPRRHPAPDELAAARLAALRPAVARPTVDPGWVPTLDDRLAMGAADPTRDSAAGLEAPSAAGGWTPAPPAPSWVAPPEEPVAGPRAPERRSWSYTSEAGGTLEDDTTEPDPTLWDRLRAGRFDPGRGGAAALALVAVVAIAITSFVVVRGRPQAVEASQVVAAGTPPAGASAGASGAPAASAAPGAVFVVAVSGDVRRPGVVRLPAGSRVDDAIRAAGGALRAEDLTLVNLARKVADGEQVIIGQAAPAAAGGGGSSAGPGAPLDLNQATADQLDALPGIGPVLADKIVTYRSEHGTFASVDQLREVSGIGESRYADLKALVRV